MTVTVAIPVRNGGALLGEVLDAVRAQEHDDEVELLVCDSSSADGSGERARAAGARVITIRPAEFSHGGTRNLLMREASGEIVAFLTQDAKPASPRWLRELLGGFALADDVALSFGPYLPRPGASRPVRRELEAWFAGFGSAPRVDRAAPDEPPAALLGARAYFTDANGAVRRSAWERVRYRDVAYAEDQALAVDLLRAGWAKAYVPSAAVEHSHDHPPLALLRRSFDEWRALREIFGFVEPLSVHDFRRHVAGPVRADGPASLPHHAARWTGALLGGRAERVPRALRRRLSLEGRW